MNEPFDSSNIDIDIDSLSQPMSFAMGGEVESMHMTPYTATNQESGDFQDAHSMPQTYSEGGDVELGDYSHTRPKQNVARQMLQSFADGGSVQGRPVGGMFDLAPFTAPGQSPGIMNATAPGGIGTQQYNKNIADFVQNNIHHNPAAITSAAQQYGVSPMDITNALGGQTLESKFRATPSYQTRPVTNADGTTKQVDFFGPATMLTGGTGTGSTWNAPVVTSRPRMLADITPGLSASQQNARNLAAGDAALAASFARTGLKIDPATYYTWQKQLDSGQIKPEDLPSKFDAPAYERRVMEAYKNIGREGMGSDLSMFHPTSMGEMYKTYINPNATTEEMASINDRYKQYGTNWSAQQANKARNEVLIPSLRAQDYYNRNPDVLQAFNAAVAANPATDYAKFALDHYNRSGKREGRTWDNKITVGEYEAPTAADFAKIDPSGYNYWLNALKSGQVSAADFDKTFYGGVASYQGPYADLYKGSMDKAAEIIRTRGLSAPTSTGRTLPGATGYQYRDQWQTAQPAADTTAARDQLSSMYQTVLGRAPDDAGLQYWMNTIGADGVLTQDEINTWNAAAAQERNQGGSTPTGSSGTVTDWRTNVDNWFQANPNASLADAQAAAASAGVQIDPYTGVVTYNDEPYRSPYARSFASYDTYAKGGEVSAAKMLEQFAKKPNGAAADRVTAPVRRAEGSPEEGEKPEPRPTDQESRPSAAETLKKVGLSVARGVPQVVTGAVDLAAMPFTMSGMVKPEEVVGSTEYLTKRGLLPPPQKGVVNETAELISSSLNPAGAVKGSAAAAMAAMTRGTGKTLEKQLSLPFGEAAKAVPEAPMIRAYTGHTREIVGPYDMSRASRLSDMGPGLYLTDNAEYASQSATKRLGKSVSESEAAPAVYPIDIMRSKILMHDQEYPREVLDKLRKFSGKVKNVEGPTVSGEYIYEQIRKAEIPKSFLPDVFKLMGFQGAEFVPGGVSKGRSYVIYDTEGTAKGAFNKKKFAEGGEVKDDDVVAFLKSKQGISDAEIAKAMQQYGVSTEQMARSTGVPLEEVQQRYRAATETPARPTFEGVAANWNEQHRQRFGIPVNLATAGQGNVDRQVGELMAETQRQQAEWDKKYGGATDAPTWGDVYNPWAVKHQQQYGRMIDRPWNTDKDSMAQKRELDQEYINRVMAYNKERGTSIAPDTSVLGVDAQPNVYYRQPEKESNPLKYALPLAVGFIAPQLGLNAFQTALAQGAASAAGGGGREGAAQTTASSLALPKVFAAGGSVTAQFIKKSSKRR
jgi:hypothetical protein